MVRSSTVFISLFDIQLAGTYGFSLLWLLAAETANESSTPPPDCVQNLPSLVIGTEMQPEKADKAIQCNISKKDCSLTRCMVSRAFYFM
jgi:hypothetical protein